jgi:hypothetical protein
MKISYNYHLSVFSLLVSLYRYLNMLNSCMPKNIKENGNTYILIKILYIYKS